MKSVHSSNPLLDVIIKEVLSAIEDINPKKRFASALLSGMRVSARL